MQTTQWLQFQLSVYCICITIQLSHRKIAVQCTIILSERTSTVNSKYVYFCHSRDNGFLTSLMKGSFVLSHSGCHQCRMRMGNPYGTCQAGPVPYWYLLRMQNHNASTESTIWTVGRSNVSVASPRLHSTYLFWNFFSQSASLIKVLDH